MDQKMSNPTSSSPKLLTFGALVANDFIVKKYETKGVPTLEKVKDKFSKKRKSRSSDSLISGQDTSSTGSNTSILEIQMKRQSTASPAPMLSDKDTDHLLMTVGRFKKEAAAIIDRIIPSVLPDAQDRLVLMQRVVALQQVFIQLNEYAQADANHSEPKELWGIEGLLMEAIADVMEHITTSVIPNAEDRLFLVGRVSALLQVLLKL